MADSAIISEESKNDDEPSLRERKKQATRLAIITAAQELTLDRGFNGFTVEQLCEQVGISRRTFFNYFGSKEDAVLGWDGVGFPADLQAEFIARGRQSPAAPGRLTPSILEDLLWMITATTDRIPHTPEQHQRLHRVILSEPQLLAKAFDSFENREQKFRELIAEREGLGTEDPRIQIAVVLVGAIMRKATEESFRPDVTEEAPQIMRRYLHAAKELIVNSELED